MSTPRRTCNLQVAKQLTEKDVIRTHARDELGIDIDEFARPWPAAAASAFAFAAGAVVPTLLLLIPGTAARLGAVIAAVLVCLAAAGALSAALGGAALWRGATRMVIGGALAMGVTYGVGHAFDTGGSVA